MTTGSSRRTTARPRVLAPLLLFTLAAGRAGMQPSLSLQYSSSGGNGLLGVGWALSGLSSITRCRKSLMTEGVVDGVSFTTADRFCLDGQKLVAVGGLDLQHG